MLFVFYVFVCVRLNIGTMKKKTIQIDWCFVLAMGQSIKNKKKYEMKLGYHISQIYLPQSAKLQIKFTIQ